MVSDIPCKSCGWIIQRDQTNLFEAGKSDAEPPCRKICGINRHSESFLPEEQNNKPVGVIAPLAKVPGKRSIG